MHEVKMQTLRSQTVAIIINNNKFTLLYLLKLFIIQSIATLYTMYEYDH